MKYRYLIITLVFAGLVAPFEGHALKKRIKIKPGDQITTVPFGGESLTCLKGTIPGTTNKKGSHFLPAANIVKKLSKKIRKRKADGKNTKKLRDRRTAAKALLETKNLACVDGGGTPPPPPGGGPNPPPSEPKAESFAALGGATVGDIAYLLEKAGFGAGPNEAGLFAMVGQPMPLVVEEFVKNKTEDSALILRMTDRLDGTMGNNPQNFPTLTGMPDALLDLTTNTLNPYRYRLLYTLLRVVDLDCSRLSNAGTNTASNNPNQMPLCWNYIKFMNSVARAPDLRNFLRTLQSNEAYLIASGNAGNDPDDPHFGHARHLLDSLLLGPYRTDANGAGVRNYTEGVIVNNERQSDLAKIARRATGLDVMLFPTSNPAISEWFFFNDNASHNNGPETIFQGSSVQISAEGIDDVMVGIIQNHPGFTEHWSRIVLEEFLTPYPPLVLVKKFAQLIQDNDFNLEPALKTLLASEAFHHANYKNTIHKNPLEQIMEYVRVNKMLLVVNRLNGVNNLNIIEGFLSTQGWDPIVNAGVRRSRWTGPTTTLEGLRYKGRIMQLAINSEGQNPRIWERHDILPSGPQTEDQMIDATLAKYKASLSPDQRIFFKFYMTFILNSGFQQYDNTDTAQQLNKGIGLQLMQSALPQHVLK